MVGVIIKAIIGLFVWLMLPQIIYKQRKFKKNTKTFINIVFKIIGIAVIIFAGIDFVKLVLNFH